MIERLVKAATLAALLTVAWTTTGQSAEDCRPDNMTGVTGDGECLAIRTYGFARDNRTLVVLVHGGRYSHDRPLSYMTRLARPVSGNGVTSVVLIRPGFSAAWGATSSSRGNRGGNWFSYDIGVVADAIARLKAYHGPERVVLVGHSIGAAIAGVIIGQTPDLVNSAVLLGCPCNTYAWDYGRGELYPSPHAVVDAVRADTEVVAITGARDTVTPSWLAYNYVAALAERGVAATFVEVANAGHGLSRRPEAREAINRLVRRFDKTSAQPGLAPSRR